MSRRSFLLICVVVCCAASCVQATQEPFSLLAFLEQHVTNDDQYGPDETEDQIGVHVRDIPERRRVGLFSFDISALKGEGIVFSDVSLSNLGAGGGNIDVYGVLEEVDNLPPRLELTWNNAPGVKNDPAPLVADPVALDHNDLTPLLMTFDAPDNQVRESTATSQALADFINSDEDGIITLLFAPPGEGDSAILRTVRSDEQGIIGGTYLEGFVGVADYLASHPAPENRDPDVYRDTVLTWTPGIYAVSHDVYVGTDYNDVSTATRDNDLDVLISQGQDANVVAPERLAFSQTYYWRVDEVNAAPDATIFTGPIWSFTAEPRTYAVQNITATASSSFNPDMGPEKTIDGSGMAPEAPDEHGIHETDMWLSNEDTNGTWIKYEFDRVYQLDQMLIWNSNRNLEDLLGFGVRDVTIKTSLDDENWFILEANREITQAPGQPGYTVDPNNIVDMGGLAAKYVQIDVLSSWGNRAQKGISEVRFMFIPVQATRPTPDNEAPAVSIDTVLKWRPGREAGQHEVSFSDDITAVMDGSAMQGSMTEARFDPAQIMNLLVGQTYYWKVDEVNDNAAVTRWQGDLWSFTLDESIMIDDFESYNNISPNRPFQTWIDGEGYTQPEPGNPGNGTGAAVGHDIWTVTSPYYDGEMMEEVIVNEGTGETSLVMPVYYNNSGNNGKAMYSEIERSFEVPQNWNRGGVDSLSLEVYGDPNNVTEPMYVGLQSATSVEVVDVSGSVDLLNADVQTVVVPLDSFGVNLTQIKKIVIGLGNSTAPQAGGSGVLLLDNLRLISSEL